MTISTALNVMKVVGSSNFSVGLQTSNDDAFIPFLHSCFTASLVHPHSPVPFVVVIPCVITDCTLH